MAVEGRDGRDTRARHEHEAPDLRRLELPDEPRLPQAGTGKNSRNFLAQLAVEYRGRRCVLVLDNTSYHTSTVVADYLRDMTDAFEVAWLPPYCPELNDIERIWKYVTGAAMANHDFGEVASLREAVHRAFEELNRSEDHDLVLRFRDPLTKDLLEAA